jgi:cytidylate kinase
MQSIPDHLIIAVDGHSSCGKSTFAKAIAKRLGYRYIDSGAMYRAVTLFCLRKHLFHGENPDMENLLRLLPEIEISFEYNPARQENEIVLNGEFVEEAIREPEVAGKVSIISKIPEVRLRLVEIQRKLGEKGGIVMDGRDIGTVVFPQADIKIFLTASPEIRAQRRFKELREKGIDISFKEVLENILERDRIDSTRSVSPLKKAPDALLLDNSHMTVEQQMEWFEKVLHERFGR